VTEGSYFVDISSRPTDGASYGHRRSVTNSFCRSCSTNLQWRLLYCHPRPEQFISSSPSRWVQI